MQNLYTGIFTMSAALALAGAATAAETTRVIVQFKPGLAASAKAAIASAHGAVKLELPELNAVAVELSVAALRVLQANPHFALVEEDVKRYPLALSSDAKKPYFSGQQVPYGIALVQADQLPDTNAGNRTLCIIDSGYDRAHEDLAGNPASGQYDRGTGWWYTDENHHGTHVAGTIAAINNAGTGVVGVAPNSRLTAHRQGLFGPGLGLLVVAGGGRQPVRRCRRKCDFDVAGRWAPEQARDADL